MPTPKREPPRAYVEAVWTACAAAGGVDAKPSRAAHRKTLELLFEQGVKAEPAGEVVAALTRQARDAYELVERSFELLASCLEGQCAALEGTPDTREQAALLARTQAGLARLLHGCATLGRLAGVEDAPSTRETVRRLDAANELEEERLETLREIGWKRR